MLLLLCIYLSASYVLPFFSYHLDFIYPYPLPLFHTPLRFSLSSFLPSLLPFLPIYLPLYLFTLSSLHLLTYLPTYLLTYLLTYLPSLLACFPTLLPFFPPSLLSSFLLLECLSFLPAPLLHIYALLSLSYPMRCLINMTHCTDTNTKANTKANSNSITSCPLHSQPCSLLPPYPEAVPQCQYAQCVKPT